MSVGIDNYRMTFEGDGVTSEFALTQILYLAAADIVVKRCDDDFGDVEDLALGADFTLTGNGKTGAGVLHLTGDPLADGKLLVVRRHTDARQQAVFNEGDGFPAKTMEGTLDRFAMVAQETRGFGEYALRVPERESGPPSVIPPAPIRANKLVMFDPEGDVRVISIEDLAELLGTGGGGGSGGDGTDDIRGAGSSDVSVGVGVGYLEVPVAAGEARRVCFDAEDDALNKKCVVRKSTEAGVLEIYSDPDFENLVAAEATQDAVTWRRVEGSLVATGRASQPA
jgi:hypothetical protein